MDSAVVLALVLMGALLLCGVYFIHKVCKHPQEKPLSLVPPEMAQAIFRKKLFFRLTALACFLAGAFSLIPGGNRILCLVFVGMGFGCQYMVYRLRCRFPAKL